MRHKSEKILNNFGRLPKKRFDLRNLLMVFLSCLTACLLFCIAWIINVDFIIALEDTREADPLGVVQLLALHQPLEKGQKIEKHNLILISWPRYLVPEGAAQSLQEIQSLYAKTSLPAKAPILTYNLVESPGENKLLSSLQ